MNCKVELNLVLEFESKVHSDEDIQIICNNVLQALEDRRDNYETGLAPEGDNYCTSVSVSSKWNSEVSSSSKTLPKYCLKSIIENYIEDRQVEGSYLLCGKFNNLDLKLGYTQEDIEIILEYVKKQDYLYTCMLWFDDSLHIGYINDLDYFDLKETVHTNIPRELMTYQLMQVYSPDGSELGLFNAPVYLITTIESSTTENWEDENWLKANRIERVYIEGFLHLDRDE